MNARDTILSILAGDGNVQHVNRVPVFNIEIPIPKYNEDVVSDQSAHFLKMLEQVHGSWDVLQNVDEVALSTMNYLDNNNLKLQVVIAPDDKLERLDWTGNDVEVTRGRAERSDRVSVTMAYAGIAETGTVAMVSSPYSPVTLSFLPEINIVVLLESRLLPTMEEFWPLIKQQPRAINFITGPSKTADIEQTIVYGAHGPKKFHVMLVKE